MLTIVMTDVCLSAAQHSKVSVSLSADCERSRCIVERYLNIASECWSHYE